MNNISPYCYLSYFKVLKDVAIITIVALGDSLLHNIPYILLIFSPTGSTGADTIFK